MTRWGGWLPWNRRWLTDIVSLGQASARTQPQQPLYGDDRLAICRNCGESFPGYTSPDGYPAYCTMVCVHAARKAGQLYE